MKVLFGFALFLLVGLPSFANAQTPSGLEVSGLKVKDDQAIVVSNQPAADRDLPEAITRPNPNAGRPRNRNESETDRLERQTNQRIQNMHVLSNAKLDSPTKETVTIAVYQSRAEMKNGTAKTVTQFAWSYRSSPQLQYTQDQEFLCRVSLKPGETKAVTVVSPAPDGRVVNVTESATTKPVKPTVTDIIINHVEFSDGTIWQRSGWNSLWLAGRGARNTSKGKCGQL